MKFAAKTKKPNRTWKYLAGLSALAFGLGGPLSGCSGDSNPAPSEPPPAPATPEVPGDDEPKFLGTAPGDEGDYTHVLSYFDQITPENAGKWGSVESERDVMDWTELDTAYEFAQANDLEFKFHVLIWGQQQPSWLDELSAQEQLDEINEWMSAVAQRYPELSMVEVVNEPLHAPATYKEALGGDGDTGWDWVVTSFELAREHFPDAQLILNDYQILHLEQFTRDYLAVIEPLIEQDLIDAIGVQAHFLERTDAETVKNNLDLLAETDLPIYVSEFDLDIEDDALHANRYQELFTVFWEHPAVAGVTVWGHREGSMWRESGYLIRSDSTEREAMVWLQCYLDGRTDCSVPEYEPKGWQGDEWGLTLEAESYDTGEGVVALGDVVAYTDNGDWIGYYSVEIQEPYDTFWLTYSKGSDAPSNITIHLNSLDSEAVMKVDLPPTAGWGSSETIEVPLASPPGTYDVYVRFNGEEAIGNLDSIRFGQPRPASNPNIVTDGGFEGSTVSGWASWNGSALALTSAQAYAGSQSLVAAERPDDQQFATYNLTDVVQPDVTYSLSAQVLHGGAASDTVRMTAKVACSGQEDDFRWIDNNTNVPPNEWTQLSGSLDLTGCDPTDVVLVLEGTSAAAGDVYVDEVLVSPPGENLVGDGGFESGFGGWDNGWTDSATLSISTEHAHSGDQSLEVSNRATADDQAGYNLTSLTEAGQSYSVIAWFLHTGPAADTAVMTAKIACEGRADTYTRLAEMAGTVQPRTWTELKGELVIPEDCVPTDVRVYFEQTGADVDFYLDDVSVMAK